MTESEELAYGEGSRAAWTRMLEMCLKQLGYDRADGAPRTREALIIEREGIIARLRDLCEQFGDNDWTPDEHLGDVLDNNLGAYLTEPSGPDAA